MNKQLKNKGHLWRLGCPKAFTLVEAALALAICGFCLVALLGLLPMALTSTGNAEDEGQAMNVIVSVAGDLSLAAKTSGSTSIYGIVLPATGGAAVSGTFSVNESGIQVPLQSQDARYLVNTRVAPPANPYGTYLIRLNVSWPASAKIENATGAVTSVVALNLQ